MRQAPPSYGWWSIIFLFVPLLAACALVGEALPSSTPSLEPTAVATPTEIVLNSTRPTGTKRPPPAYLSVPGVRQEGELGTFSWWELGFADLFALPLSPLSLAVPYGSPVWLDFAHPAQPETVSIDVYPYLGKKAKENPKLPGTFYYQGGFSWKPLAKLSPRPERMQAVPLDLAPGEYTLHVFVRWPAPEWGSASYGFHITVLNEDGTEPTPKRIPPDAMLNTPGGSQVGQRGSYTWNDGAQTVRIDSPLPTWEQPVTAIEGRTMQLRLDPFDIELMGDIELAVTPGDPPQDEPELARFTLPGELDQKIDLDVPSGTYRVTITAPWDAGTVPYYFLVQVVDPGHTKSIP
ncbi:MAG: hypothetical protein HYX89_02410 [Chloroflexi bacterium]|nr:hypothetical protein [Chloroflexota bacterium]